MCSARKKRQRREATGRWLSWRSPTCVAARASQFSRSAPVSTYARCWKAWRTFRSARKSFANDCGTARANTVPAICTGFCRAPLQGWRALKIGLAPEREALYGRIHARTNAMLANGWLEEVRSLLNAGLPEDAKAFDFIGYRELRAVLQGRLTLDEARATIQQATRRYAKRQLTWFRREHGVRWLAGFGDNPLLQQEALLWLREQGVLEGRGADARRV